MIRRVLEGFATGHERRAKLLVALAAVCLLAATVGALSAPDGPRVTEDDERPENNTLVGLQGYHDEGRAIEISPDGEVVWEYDEPDDVFDVERLGPDRVQLSTATEVPDEECPPRYRDDGFENCVRNSLRIVEQSSDELVWEYAWYDAKLHEHELHDADHYVVGSEDRWVLADMGNDRVFAVNREKEVVWQWNATDDYERPEGMGPEGDWTHLNDVDRLGPGVFQVSLRNFDTVVELRMDEESGPIRVRPVVGPDDFHERGEVLHEQHNPDRLADDHLLVADSERDRVVELDADREVVWEFGGSGRLQWPRDADRLPDGDTLITDSYNGRVMEVNPEGEVVWAVETGGLPYEADRLPGEGSADRPTADEAGLADSTADASVIREDLDYATAMARYAVPPGWGGQVAPLAVAALSLVGAAIEGLRSRRE
ncbi:hypothetical protein NGM10_06135 [Halorussus salilacus]|uniref:hypothetical protein n=1 Tax=Halorussus salilacus TaxID=2953750 RepID=UPI00209FEE47|nr:hypothetical protein [Halorussus salilacus]USZ69313.1 hypothetical protein NGM10_06135 [Halorussus salilacus]